MRKRDTGKCVITRLNADIAGYTRGFNINV